jgi:hypothetical protein
MAVPKTFATLMGQALPRYDYLNPTDSWRKYRIYRAQVIAVTATWMHDGCDAPLGFSGIAYQPTDQVGPQAADLLVRRHDAGMGQLKCHHRNAEVNTRVIAE